MFKPHSYVTKLWLATAVLSAALGVTPALSYADDVPWVIGHRGLGQKHAPEPENSLVALRGAFESGVNAVEFDVQLSNDGEVVLAHDPRLERMTNGEGCVAEHSLAQLRTYKLKDSTDKVHVDLPMSTLSEALEAIRGYDNPERPFLADIHIKVYDLLRGDMVGPLNGGCPRTHYVQLTDAVLNAVRTSGLLDRVIFTSFDPRVLDRIKLQYPSERVGLLTAIAPGRAIAKAQVGRYEYVAVDKDHFFTQKHIQDAHNAGLGVLVWSPASQDELHLEAAMGVDGWITDNVPGAVSIAAELSALQKSVIYSE